jgi:hypothetical protein
MKINIIVPNNKAAWITAVSKNISFTIITNDTDIVELYNFAKLEILKYSNKTLNK